MSSTSSFLAAIEKRLDRAREMIDEVDDLVAYRALDALYGVFEIMLSDAIPQVVVMEMPDKDTKSGAPKASVVQTKDTQTAGEKIAGKGGHYL